MKQVLPVKNLMPAVVKVYDYYQTSKILYVSAESFYHVRYWLFIQIYSMYIFPLLYEC